ncbi:hypothetical protein SPRG_20536 [Saprolegnia parasitica CBS 223.65]|uniref:Uncharacterized protein n=1 Tax=Saprolegnia parasitica (strain CBS 223.65) TaxID=695850 RepID=A0A067C8D4_SAPPC|nr:hypothetical protein SPRG_20536 [Saprolegnia parasitica CBS 223.65]KDO26738.1 hypothetical protein SPRG_20536 [Saprolegnia parasitica CBS 223.65]|eukprot:XP_012202618.1 hypothetical protein SPRG_20536 [Saprolegnia parasitica CBS 223.65]
MEMKHGNKILARECINGPHLVGVVGGARPHLRVAIGVRRVGVEALTSVGRVLECLGGRVEVPLLVGVVHIAGPRVHLELAVGAVLEGVEALVVAGDLEHLVGLVPDKELVEVIGGRVDKEVGVVLAEAVAARRREADVLGLGRRAVDKRRARELAPVARAQARDGAPLELVGAQTVGREACVGGRDAVASDRPFLQLLGPVAGRCAHNAVAKVGLRHVGHGLEALAVALGHERAAGRVEDEDFVAVGAHHVRVHVAVVLGRDEARRRAELLLLETRRERARARRDDGAKVDVGALPDVDRAVAGGREREALEVVALGHVAVADAEVAGRRANVGQRLAEHARRAVEDLGARVGRVGQLLVARAGDLGGGGGEKHREEVRALHVDGRN